MKFKEFAGTSIVPTLARVVLALAFTTAGYHKLFTEVEYTSDQKVILEGYGVELTPKETVAGVERQIRLAAFRQDAQETPPKDPATVPPPATGQDADKPAAGVEPPPDEAGTKPAAGVEAPQEEKPDDKPAGGDAEKGSEPVIGPITTPPATDAVFTALGMHKVTLLCHDAGWPSPSRLALLAALTEFVGGILILIGFLSRVWGLGLAIAMGVALHLTSWDPYFSQGPLAVASGADGFALFNRFFVQMSLLVLALGVFLTGPGPLSIDRLLFRRRRSVDGEIRFDDDDDAAGGASSRPM